MDYVCTLPQRQSLQNKERVLLAFCKVVQASITVHYCPRASKCHLMSEGQWFGISGALHWSKLLYGKIRADANNIYKGDNEPYVQSEPEPSRREKTPKKAKKPK